MFIESVRLTNFQCFGPEAKPVSLDSDLTALIGGNGSGKTALCQALLRLFGITQDQRQVRVADFHVPADETTAPSTRSLTVDVVLAFPELDNVDEEDPQSVAARDSVPEFFQQMTSTNDGALKCRMALHATWTDDGSVDGTVEEERRIVHTFDDEYGDQWSALRGGDRNRIQVVYLPPSRDGVRQVASFLRGRLWRASRWSSELTDQVDTTSTDLLKMFQAEPVVTAVTSALSKRWGQLHSEAVCAVPSFQPISADARELFRHAQLLFEPTTTGRANPASELSDGQRSLLHLALTAATLDIETEVAAGNRTDEFQLATSTLPTLTIFVVEEPENHLAPFFLSRVVGQLLELSAGPRVQAILSSHSAGALSRVQPHHVRYLRRSSSGCSDVRTIDLPDSQTEAAKYIREAVRAHPELYFARHVVLCEGDSEEIVIPILAQAQGLPIDRSFVAIVPLGGRHTNHFWRLMNSLDIPHATLLDLDWGRKGGGAGRIRTTCEQLQANGIDPFDGIDGYTQLEDIADTMDVDELQRWLTHLRRWHIYFSAPLDLDMLLLEAFSTSYTTNLDQGARGPDFTTDAAPAVLGDHRPTVERWTTTKSKKLLNWYRYLFTNRSKPATHLRAFAQMSDVELAHPPEVLDVLISDVKAAITPS
ncbi:AAA family ATPase [Mycolicibacterium septicum]|nr:AAA family ATPase [Mycolicibacterium septicum]